MMDLQLLQNDLLIQSGDIEITASDVDAISQAIRIRLKTLAGEWFLDNQIGIPYLTEILGHKRNDRFLRHLIIPVIEAVPGILKVSNFHVTELPNRSLTISFEAMLTDQTRINIKESMEF